MNGWSNGLIIIKVALKGLHTPVVILPELLERDYG
jgi:hypothetical protein